MTLTLLILGALASIGHFGVQRWFFVLPLVLFIYSLLYWPWWASVLIGFLLLDELDVVLRRVPALEARREAKQRRRRERERWKNMNRDKVLPWKYNTKAPWAKVDEGIEP